MIELELYYTDLRARGVKAFAALVAAFERCGLAPDDFGNERTLAAMLKQLSKDDDDDARLIFAREHATPHMSAYIAVASEPWPDSGTGTTVRCELPSSKVALELAIALASWGTPLYGFAHDKTELAYVPKEKRASREEAFELQDIYSINVLGKAMVDAIGRKRVLDTPGVTISELQNGSIVIDAGEDPAVHARAIQHLRPEVDAAIRRIPAPVVRTWDLDVSPFFEQVVAWELPPQRNAKIAELNAIATEVTELRKKPLAANTKTPLRFRSAADDFFAIFHDKVKGLKAKGSPAILPDLDMHFYTNDYPGTFGRARADTLIEPLGAWLGQLLVTELEGEWVPRTTLAENQVVVGDTAYLPFLLAEHYLASKRAVLEHSLTAYFAHARNAAT